MNSLSQHWKYRLRQLRRDLSFIQEEMAERLGITREWYSKLESGREQVSELIARRIVDLERENLLAQIAAASQPETELATKGPKGERAPKSPADDTVAPNVQDCLDYFRAYMLYMSQVPGGVGHAWVQLQLHFPFTHIDRLQSKKDKEKE